MFDRPLYKRIALQQLKGRWTPAVLVTLVTYAIETILGIAVTKSELPKFCICAVYLIIFVLSMALVKFFITMSRTPEAVPFSEWTKGFDMWAKAILTYAWMFLWTFLWSLLFIIPGIVKSFAYSFTPYIVAENPNISVSKALTISKVLTNGHKMDLFILQLSFWGWLLLASLTGGIGGLWVIPYMQLSSINAFHDIKKQALGRGIIEENDFA
mgnify:CR=1 FL=1